MDEEKAFKVPLYCWIWVIVSLVAIVGCLYYRYTYPEKYDGTYWEEQREEEFTALIDSISEDGEIVHIIETDWLFDTEKEKEIIEKEAKCGYELIIVNTICDYKTRMYFKLVGE